MQIETKYAKSSDIHVAYQVVGQGPINLVLLMGWVSHLDYGWEGPSLTLNWVVRVQQARTGVLRQAQ